MQQLSQEECLLRTVEQEDGMGEGRKAALAALAWTGIVAAGLVACGGGGGGGSAATSATGASTTPVDGSPAGTPSTVGGAAGDAGSSTTLGNCEMFPPQAVFNTRIDDTNLFPARAESAAWVASIGTSIPFRADWWLGTNPAQWDAYYGIPFNTVDGTAATTDWPVLSYDFAGSGVSNAAGWPHESDCAVADGSGFRIARNCSAVPAAQRRFPFPRSNLLNEGGTCNDPNTCGDHHVLVVEQGACRLWEAYHAYNLSGRWHALSTAAWDLKSLALRPNTWTSGDAAGLPITPFLAKAAEASSGEIRHALRVTLRDSAIANSYVWPARHAAGSSAGSVPFGAVMRLKKDFVIPAHWTTQAKAIATAAKQYGLYVADIGSDFYVQGEPSAQWQEQTFRDLRAITMQNMEFVDLGAVTRDPRFSADSMAARW
jgi:hypothetical protein